MRESKVVLNALFICCILLYLVGCINNAALRQKTLNSARQVSADATLDEYLKLIRERILIAALIPDSVVALPSNVQNIVGLQFTIRNDGSLLSRELLLSSGNQFCDQEALQAIAQASPFPPFPAEIKHLETKTFKIEIMYDGTKGGIGAELSKKEDYVEIVRVLSNRPAYKAGLQTGDRIIAVNGVSVKDDSLYDAIVKIIGKDGTKVTLSVIKKNQLKPIVVELTREKIF